MLLNSPKLVTKYSSIYLPFSKKISQEEKNTNKDTSTESIGIKFNKALYNILVSAA